MDFGRKLHVPSRGGGLNIKFWFLSAKKHIFLRENVSLYVLRVKIQAGALAVGDDTKQKKNKRTGVRNFKENKLLKCTKFGDDQLRGFGMGRGQVSPFSIGLSGHL